MRRRTVVTGLAGLAATTALPALGQAIGRQSDPYAQVDPYADPRNGGGVGSSPPARAMDGPRSPMASATAAASPSRDAPKPPSEQEMAANTIEEILADPDRFELMTGEVGLYHYTVVEPHKGQGNLLRNSAAQRAFQRFCQPFFEATDRSNLPWEAYLTDFPKPNGLAFGGGKMTIAVGTVIYADHPSELGSIVAHEIGHNDYRHIFLAQQAGALLALNGRDGGEADATSIVIDRMGPMFKKVLESGFSREQEYEADSHAPLLLSRLGMDPSRYISMFAKMMKIYNDDPNQKTCLLDSHPVMRERIAAVQSQIGFNYKHGPNEFSPPGWEELKRIFPTPAAYRRG